MDYLLDFWLIISNKQLEGMQVDKKKRTHSGSRSVSRSISRSLKNIGDFSILSMCAISTVKITLKSKHKIAAV